MDGRHGFPPNSTTTREPLLALSACQPWSSSNKMSCVVWFSTHIWAETFMRCSRTRLISGRLKGLCRVLWPPYSRDRGDVGIGFGSNVDLDRPVIQTEIRRHIVRCLRDFPRGGEGAISLGGVEHHFTMVRDVNGEQMVEV